MPPNRLELLFVDWLDAIIYEMAILWLYSSWGDSAAYRRRRVQT
ncbi:hypothetical protein GGE07_001013 [Sinorhizobium terangae]|nr:hypothetical protein [Sinorhizobium terangae]